jgi:uncharacterized CHY-type Zn-finger protein
MRGACLLSRRSEDVSISFGRASVHCEDYWITGSIKNCQRRFVEKFGGKQAPRTSPHDWLTTRAASSWLSLSYLMFRVANFLFANSQNTTALHYRYDFCSFCKPTFSEATREWDALYFSNMPLLHEHHTFMMLAFLLLQISSNWCLNM